MDIRKSDSFSQYLDKIHQRFVELSEQLTLQETSSQPKKFGELSRELFRLRALEEKYHEYRKLLERRAEAESLQDSQEDAELAEMARQELAVLGEMGEKLRHEVENLIVVDQVEEERNVFLEIRSGAGGDEASLFVADLFRMYSRLAEKMKWKVEPISIAYSGIGGIKEVVLYIKGKHVYKFLRFESGVHRVQRVPLTEASGRIHTSTVTVAVLPEAEDVEIQIDPKDIRIDTFAASGPGGQHVNKTESAIRITHFPTGIVVTCQDEKSQHKNKDKALKVLQARLLEFETSKKKENIDLTRRAQVGSAERSEKIRTYNFPQCRVTDHRINGKNFNIEFVLNGDFLELIELLNDNHKRALVDEKMKAL